MVNMQALAAATESASAFFALGFALLLYDWWRTGRAVRRGQEERSRP